LLSAISRLGIYKRNLLETRVIIASYNDHGPAPFYPSLHGWFWHHQAYSSLGAGIVMESIKLVTERLQVLWPGYNIWQRLSDMALCNGVALTC
jgi:hypothetical protein